MFSVTAEPADNPKTNHEFVKIAMTHNTSANFCKITQTNLIKYMW